MRPNRRLLVHSLILLSPLLAACTGDDIVGSVLWDLQVVNNSTFDLDLYEDIDVDTEGFGLVASIDAATTFVLERRVASATYRFRLVDRGAPADSVRFERTIVSNGRDEIWIVP